MFKEVKYSSGDNSSEIKSYIRIFGFFLALSGLMAVMSIGFFLGGSYGPQTPEETRITTTVTGISYGFSESSASKDFPENPAGESCFIGLTSGETLSTSLLSCDLSPGDTVDILVSDSGSTRLSPESSGGALPGLHFILGVGILVLMGGLGALTYSFFPHSRRKRPGKNFT